MFGEFLVAPPARRLFSRIANAWSRSKHLKHVRLRATAIRSAWKSRNFVGRAINTQPAIKAPC